MDVHPFVDSEQSQYELRNCDTFPIRHVLVHVDANQCSRRDLVSNRNRLLYNCAYWERKLQLVRGIRWRGGSGFRPAVVWRDSPLLSLAFRVEMQNRYVLLGLFVWLAQCTGGWHVMARLQ